MTDRLKVLHKRLGLYKRRFSVFDFGSGVEDGIGHEIATNYDAVVVAAEMDPLKYTPSGRMMVIRRKLGPEQLDTLSLSYHFDVVLALNILHWMDKDWLRYFRALSGLGDYLIVQCPYPSDRDACGQTILPEIYALMLNSESLCLGETSQFPQHPSRPIYGLVGSHSRVLTAKSYGSGLAYECIRARVNAGFHDKVIHLLHKNVSLPYIHGLSLSSFYGLGGVWPHRHSVTRLMQRIRMTSSLEYTGPLEIPSRQHGDIRPWNIIFDGQEMHLIDPAGPDWGAPDTDNLADAIKQVDMEMLKWER